MKKIYSLLLALVCSVGLSWAETLTIDCESAASSYTDWTITNLTFRATNSNVTAHGGSYFGKTDGTTTASIVTKELVAAPTSITFYVSKQTTNTTASSWKVQVSTNGTSWTDVKTQSASSMDRGAWVEVTQSLSTYSNVYVRVYYDGTTAVRCIDDLTLTYSAGDGGSGDGGEDGGDQGGEDGGDPEPSYACSVTSPVLGYEAFGLTPDGSNTYAQPGDASHVITFDGISLTLTKNSGTALRFDDTYARVYNNNTMTITAPATCKILKIELNKAGGDWKGGMTVNPACANYNDGDETPTWTGEATSVTFTPGGTHRLASVTVYLDKKVGSFTLANINGTGWGTYYTDFAFVMPENVEGRLMKNVEGTIKAVTTYAAGTVVPANTGLLLKGTAGNYNLVETTTAATISAEGNLLKGSVEGGLTTGGTVYYKLANDAIDGLGWYWGAADGAAFTCGAHKAYLALDAAPSLAPAAIHITDETDAVTSIENIEADHAVKFFENGQIYIRKNGNVYNVAGQIVR